MDSIDAQQLLIHTLEAEMPPPDLWQHHRSGELSCAYSGGERTFTWDADAVAGMARNWRETARDGDAGDAQLLIDAHRRLDEIIRDAGRPPADAVVHDLDRRELRVIWRQDKLVVVIDEFPDGAGPSEVAGGLRTGAYGERHGARDRDAGPR